MRQYALTAGALLWTSLDWTLLDCSIPQQKGAKGQGRGENEGKEKRERDK